MTIAVPTGPEEGVTEVTIGIPAITFIVTLFEVAVAGLAQVALLVRTQVTICPLVNVVVVYVALFVPTFEPFTFH